MPSGEQSGLLDRPEFPVTHSLEAGDNADRDLFEGGPPVRLQTFLGLMRPGRPHVALRIIVCIAAGWLPLALITAVQSAILHDGSFLSFLCDYSVHARSLIAVPLLIIAEIVCLPRLSAIARHFHETGLIAPNDMPAFRRAVSSTRRLRDSMRLEVALVALAIITIVTAEFTVPHHLFPPWQQLHARGTTTYSPAGWWHSTVSVWILLVLVLGWIWRLVLWIRFLFLLSRLKLRLVAAHPDRAGGLRFIGVAVQAFSVLAFSLSVIVAGTCANRIIHDGASILSFKYVVLGHTAVVTALFTAPLAVFAGQLLDVWRRGVFAYGALARDVGLQMEHKWLNRAADATALDAPDFSATTDLYAIAGNVYAMNVIPISLTNIAALIVATLLPFIPVVLFSVSPVVILQKLTGILL